MLHFREWIVVMVQQGAPLVIARRLPESLCVMLQCFPVNQQQVAVAFFQATLQLMRMISGRGRQNSLHRCKICFESRLLSEITSKTAISRTITTCTYSRCARIACWRGIFQLGE